jgi:hypothetical protein
MASSASQRRAALATTTSSTGWTSVGEPLMTRKTSAVAVCRSSASSRSILHSTMAFGRAAAISGLESAGCLFLKLLLHGKL